MGVVGGGKEDCLRLDQAVGLCNMVHGGWAVHSPCCCWVGLAGVWPRLLLVGGHAV